ncbi:MAG: HEPN domain-containing protein [Methanomicrobiales archaeon]|nr:HEPN domain-containing protein [Methanomicrobiales archaeon]
MVKRLEKEGKIEKFRVDPKVVKESMTIAERDLAVAEKNLEINDEWAWNIAYNAILSAGRALMFAKGYRPKGDERHVAVREFLERILIILPLQPQELYRSTTNGE